MRSKYLAIIIVLGIVNLLLVWQVYAGSPDSPGPPESTSSYTLADLYNRLSAGTTGSQSTFTEPSTAPGTGTRHTLNEIMAVAPVADDANGAVSAEVLSGQTFWGLNAASGQWGLQSGSLVETAIPVQSAVPKTGQTTCYAANGTVSMCAGTGQDGEYQLGTNAVLEPSQGTSGAYLVPGWTGARFTDNGDGTVRDNLTGLIWLKDASCSELAGTDAAGQGSWTTALSAANSLASGTCGLSDGSSAGDWRLPNVNELHSLIDLSQSFPALPAGHPFTGVQLFYYFSSTTYAPGPLAVWSVYLNSSGNVDNILKTFASYIWPVRGGQ
jgi:hypothetical protein